MRGPTHQSITFPSQHYFSDSFFLLHLCPSLMNLRWDLPILRLCYLRFLQGNHSPVSNSKSVSLHKRTTPLRWCWQHNYDSRYKAEHGDDIIKIRQMETWVLFPKKCLLNHEKKMAAEISVLSLLYFDCFYITYPEIWALLQNLLEHTNCIPSPSKKNPSNSGLYHLLSQPAQPEECEL